MQIIKSEADAYELLRGCYEGRIDVGKEFEIKFEGWPVLEIRMVGDRFSSTITPTVMQGLIDFQKAIYKSYSLSKYNHFNTRKLSKAEKDGLEIRVKVSDGSSLIGVDFQAAIENFMMGLAGKMEPTHIIIVILSIAAMYFGVSAYRSYLQDRKETRIAESKSKETLELIRAQHFASEQETERMKLIADIASGNPAVNNARTYSYEAHTGLLKSVQSADSAEIDGLEIDGDVAGELVKNARRKANEIRLDGRYRIMMVDSSAKEDFKVRVMDLQSLNQFNADVQDKTLDSKYKAVIQKAEWEKTPVKLAINAREVGGEIRKAVILSAEVIGDSRP